MNISLSQNSDVPLRRQLSEQIVFLITTGELAPGEEMPSVRALARTAKVHHNTVSKAYQDLVLRRWLTRKHGSRLVVRVPAQQGPQPDAALDELINETVRRAKSRGYPLQALRQRVRERLLAEPADHILVIEDEPGLRAILRREMEEKTAWRVECCAESGLIEEPGIVMGAQVVAPGHVAGDLKMLIPAQRPCFELRYSNAVEEIAAIRALGAPSHVAVVSVSESVLKTARSLFAPSIGRKHTYRDVLLTAGEHADMRGADLTFCDSIAFPVVTCRRKMQYRLIAQDCMKDLCMLLDC